VRVAEADIVALQSHRSISRRSRPRDRPANALRQVNASQRS
jgi:hypothetical protein